MKSAKANRMRRAPKKKNARYYATECLEARLLLSGNTDGDIAQANPDGTFAPLSAMVSTGFQPLSPDGSLAYVLDISDRLETNSSEKTVPIELEAGQRLSLEIAAGSLLTPSVIISDPNNQVLRFEEAQNVGDGLLLNNIAISNSGTHVVQVFDDLGSIGEFNGRIAINSAFEAEQTLGTPNDSILTAENIDGAFNQVGTVNQRRAHVTGTRGSDLEEDFETETLGPEWSTQSFGDQGRIRISKAAQADSGVNFLLLDREVQLNDTLNEAIWTVDLSNATGATLEFSHARFNDEEHRLPFFFTGHVNGDGVALSVDGLTWHTILNSPQTENFEWNRFSIDLVEFANSRGITLDRDVHIKFQQFDNGPFSSDGRGYDAIKISTTPDIGTEDWYAFSLEDGQYLSLAMNEVDFSVGSTIELYNSNQTLIATSSPSQNASQVIVNYLDVTTNGTSDEYYVRVVAPAEEYGLLATKDLSFDKEANSSFFSAQDISNTQSTLGFVDDSAGTSLNLLSSFPGTDFTRFVPADPIIAAGPTHVVTVVNSRIGIYDKATGQQVFTQPISDPTGFFGSVGAQDTTFDPWILYDTATERFFIVAIDVESDEQAHLYFAVSTSSTPTSGTDWNKYQLDFAHDPEPLNLGTGLHFADYEKIGVSDDAIFVSGNYFAINQGSGVYTGITAFDKQAMINGEPLEMLYQEFFLGFSVFPLHQYDSTTTQYFVESLSENQVRVHAVTDVATNPVRHTADITVPLFARPGLVPQMGDVVDADVLDARIMSGVLRDQSAWVAHTVVDPTLDDENVARWYEIDINDFPNNSPTLIQHGNVDPGPNVHAFFPAITVDEGENMGIGFSLGGPDMFLSAGFTGRMSSDPLGTTAFPVQQYVSGLAPYENLRGGRNRWGDYSGIAIDPTDDRTFWVYNLYASESGTWDTQVGSFQLDPTPDSDWYSFEVNQGDVVTIETNTPFDGSNEVANLVDLEIELYDAFEQRLAFDLDSAADGRNAKLTLLATSSGTYRARVIPTTGTGTYVLNINGATGSDPPPSVVASSPTDGHIVNQFPTTYEIIFSEQIDPTTVSNTDLTINGIPTQDVDVLGNRIVFTIDPASNSGDGSYNLNMAAGSVADFDGNVTIEPFVATWLFDSQGVSITSTRWNGLPFPEDATLRPQTLVFEAFLTEPPFQLASARRGLFAPGTDDIILTNTQTGRIVEESSIDVNTITNVFSATYEDLPEGSYELRLISGPGAFLDQAGNSLDGEFNPETADGTPTGDGIPGGDYVINFLVDEVTQVANTFERTGPLGGLSSRSRDNSGFLHSGSDIDRISFFAEAGEKISAVATISGDANANLRIVGLGQPTTSQIIGADVVIEPQLIPSTGAYELEISGDENLGYSIDIFRNSVSESAINDSSESNVLSASESFVTLGSGRFGILGDSSPQFDLVQSNDPSKFVDISSVADNVLDLSDDGEVTIQSSVSNIAIPTTQVTVGNNGGLLEGMDINLVFQNLFLPSPDIKVDTAFYPYWEDLGVSRDHIYVHEMEIDGIPALVVQWEQMPHADFDEAGDITFQLQIFDSGPVLARYVYEDVEFGEPSIDFGGNATIGYENVDGRFVQYSLNTANAVANGDVLELILAPDTDVYSIDLSSHIGQTIDIVLKGLDNRSFSGELLELLDSNGNVVATGASDPLGSVATNYNLGILGYTVADLGTNVYQLRVTSNLVNEYGIEITESIVFESEPNLSGNPTRELAPTSTLMGYLSAIDLFDVFSIDLIAGQKINLQTSTPFDSPERSPLNSLNPTLRILGPNGRTQLAIDRDSKDGKNAELTFEAPTTDTYFVEVQIGGGLGEYLLHVEQLDLPSLSISDATIVEGDNGTSLLEFSVSRSSNVSQVSVEVVTENGTAVAGQDFVALDTTIQFEPGGDFSKTIQVAIIGDQIQEPDEEFNVQLRNAIGATFEDATGVGTIVDNDEDVDTVTTIESVRISSSDWTSGFLAYIDADLQLGYPIPDGSEQLTTISWEGLDQIHVEFSRPVSIGLGDVSINGVHVADYASRIESVEFNEASLIATISLTSPFEGDRIQLNIFDDVIDEFGNFLDGDWEDGITTGPSGDGNSGGTFSYSINILPGDVNGSALVDTADILATQRLRFENVTTEAYDPRADLDGSGIIDSNDLLGVQNLRFTFLPVAQVAASVAEDDRDADEQDEEKQDDGLTELVPPLT